MRPGDAKKARLNGAPLRAAEQLRSEVSTLVFTPDRLVVVKGGPAARRAYFDRALGRLFGAASFPARAGVPAEYGAAVAQRNAALRRVAIGASSRDAVSPWTERVAELGGRSSRLAARRSRCSALCSSSARTSSACPAASSATKPSRRRPRRSRRGSTTISTAERPGLGPHLDDVEIRAGRPRPAALRLAGRAAPRRPVADPRRGGAPGRARPRAAAAPARRRPLRARRGQARRARASGWPGTGRR